MFTKLRRAAVLALPLLAFAAPAPAAEVYMLTANGGNRIIIINGALDYDTPRKFRWALQQFGGRAGIVLNSNGGYTSVTREIMRLILYMPGGAKTSVPAGATCASACVDLLIAGTEILYSPYARVGVHQALSVATQTRTRGSLAADLEGVTNYTARGVPASVLRGMVNTPPSAMYWVSATEMQQIPGVRQMQTTGTIHQIIADAQYRVI